MLLYHIPSLAAATDPLTAMDHAGRQTVADAAWWQSRYPGAWRALLASPSAGSGGYAIGIHDDPAPFGLGPPTIESDNDGLPIIRRKALPPPVDTRTEAERLAAKRAAMSCSPLAGELVLAQHGLRDAWLALIATRPVSEQIRYQRAPLWRRSDPLFELAIATLRPDATTHDERAQILDALFSDAMQIDATSPAG